MNTRIRIYMAGVGGQGTLTATTLLARTALDQGLEVVAGEVHGMAQRGGVVESVVLLGGWQSPKLWYGEADIVMGFELLESLRALPYLAPQGTVFSSIDTLPPLSVSLGQSEYPAVDGIKDKLRAAAKTAYFLPCRTIGLEAGAVQSGNTALLGALCASGLVPFGPDALEAAVRKYLPAKVQDVNCQAARLGAAAFRNA